MSAFHRKEAHYGKREHAVARAAALKKQGYSAAIKQEHGGWSVYVSGNRSSDLRRRE